MKSNADKTRSRSRRQEADAHDTAEGARGARLVEEDSHPADVKRPSWLAGLKVNLRTYSLPVLQALFRTKYLGLGILVCLMLLSAQAVVYSTHLSRQLFSELKTLQEHRDRIEREWTQLLLEQSAWSTHHRIERLATERLGMVMPDMAKVEVVR